MAYDEQISYKRVKLNWIKLNGFYDNLNITRVLISTESRRFFTSVNYSEQENCKIGFKTMDIVSYVNASKEASFLYSDMCPLSSYNFTLTVNRKNFTSTTTYYQLTTSEYRHILIFIVLILRKKTLYFIVIINKAYQNVDCEDLMVTTIRNLTIIEWKLSKMHVTYYYIRLTTMKSTPIFETTLVNRNRTRSVEIFGLDYNTKYRLHSIYIFKWQV